MSGTATGIVPFNYAAWIVRYPAFTNVSEALGQQFWNEAGLYLNNTAASAVQNLVERGMILGMITAHLAQLNVGQNGQAPSGLVGRLSSASEGSVSVSSELPNMPMSAAWFSQTQYGLSAWQAMAPYRMARYKVAPQPPVYQQGLWPGSYPGGVLG